jgi:excisionase family DNA binding protein
MKTVPVSRLPLVAPVGGFAAFVLAKVLDDALPSRLVGLQRQAEAGRLHPDLVAEVTSTWSAIREAGRQWSEHRSAVDGSAAEPVTAIPARSAEIDTDKAADLLGVTPNRVRQLVRGGDIQARKVGRVWLVDRTAIELRREYDSGPVR